MLTLSKPDNKLMMRPSTSSFFKLPPALYMRKAWMHCTRGTTTAAPTRELLLAEVSIVLRATPVEVRRDAAAAAARDERTMADRNMATRCEDEPRTEKERVATKSIGLRDAASAVVVRRKAQDGIGGGGRRWPWR